MKRITIDIFGEEDGKLIGLIDVNSNELNFNYGSTLSMHGLQCKFEGDTKEFLAVQDVLEKITGLVRELNKIYK